METSKIKDDFRFKFAVSYSVIAIMLIIGLLIIFIFDGIIGWTYYLWCLAFTLLGFCLLILKVCINHIKKVTNLALTDNEELENKKIRLRYFRFYPFLIIVMAIFSAIISITHFAKLEGIQPLVASALLSFFLGFFIDSIPNVIEKVGKALSN